MEQTKIHRFEKEGADSILSLISEKNPVVDQCNREKQTEVLPMSKPTDCSISLTLTKAGGLKMNLLENVIFDRIVVSKIFLKNVQNNKKRWGLNPRPPRGSGGASFALAPGWESLPQILVLQK